LTPPRPARNEQTLQNSGASLARATQIEGETMSRICELTGTGPMVGHRVSHSNIKSKRRFLPNLLDVKLRSETLGQTYRLKIAAKALRTVDKLGGLDAFLAKAKDDGLSERVRKIKREIVKKQAEA
jgi:large subunit ribosomal protein L28